ncbi:hypothetical protein GCM10028784_18770 [Myceligenerans cantabricum]
MNPAPDPRAAAAEPRLVAGLSDAYVLFHESVGVRRGLSPGDHKALSAIERSGPLTASELARRTGLTAGAVTGLVNRLVEGGYVQREPFPTDGRRVLISAVGTSGDRVLSDARAILERESDALLEACDEHQRTAVVHWIRTMTDHLNAQSRRIAR